MKVLKSFGLLLILLAVSGDRESAFDRLEGVEAMEVYAGPVSSSLGRKDATRLPALAWKSRKGDKAETPALPEAKPNSRTKGRRY